ncbi:Hypothetical protein GLP15_3072 [Giardia lamblia P15]|uniref:DNA recombination and repair protein Rad51-like C-terminal domain-containing protein n=1 Tax=Giardia intestinalis (strain P15) TaxID=658858 RepID=E1F949_GIAIA|nr:Hypothetical protein GLP15_3072 [Giardia lamblia P15]
MNRRKYGLDFGEALRASFLSELGGLTIANFLDSDSYELAIKQNKSVREIEEIKSRICDACGIVRSFTSTGSGLQLESSLFIPNFKHLKTMLPLDLVLTSVIQEQHITEIAGESGTGKTRILLYIISIVLLTTDHYIALIVTSVEDVLGILVDLLTSLSPLLIDTQVNVTMVLKRLYFLREPSPTGLLKLFESSGQVWELCRQCPALKLICIDSIGFLRILYTKPNSNESQLNNPGYEIGQALVNIACLKNLAVLLTNHVGDYIASPQLASSAQQHSRRHQFPGQSIPNALPRLPTNVLPTDQLYVYTPVTPSIDECEDRTSTQLLIQGDSNDSQSTLVLESMMVPSTSLLFPEAVQTSYKSDRTFSRDVVMSSNRLVTPSLGISWGSHISTRIILALTQKETILHLLWSEFLPACSLVVPRIPDELINHPH